TPRPVATAGPDIALWRHDQDDFKPYFSASKTWNYLRVKKTKPPWNCIYIGNHKLSGLLVRWFTIRTTYHLL
ncbi:hypothetical protein HID58_041077, partial [Brassica napus]